MEKQKRKIKIDVPTNELPPQNISAEQSILGSILIDKNAIFKVVDKITSEDFYRQDHGEIFRGMLELTEKRQPVDILTLSDLLENKKLLKDLGGASYLSELVALVSSSANVGAYAEIVQNLSTLRKLISAGSNIVELGFHVEDDTNALIDEAEKLIFDVSRHFIKGAFTPIQDILSTTFERIDDLHKHKGKLRGVPTGFKDLDNLLAGMQNSDLVIIAARPSMGKTTFALNIAMNAAVREKVPVAIFSLEQSEDQLVDRMLVSQAAVDSWKLRTGNLSDQDFPQIGEAMGVLSEAPIYIDDSPLINIMEMRAKARRLQSEKGLGLIILDYLQLMSGSSRSGDSNRVQEISEISRGLKAIARELNVPVIALSQLSRAVEMRHPKIPQLADLRESGCLSGDTMVLDSGSGKLITMAELANLGTAINPISLNPQLKLESTKIQSAFSTGVKNIFEIALASGKKIKATANHKLLTISGWEKLENISANTFLATPRKINYLPSGKMLNTDELILIGHLIGDGCTLSHQPIHYTNQDLECHDLVSQAARRLFGIEPRLIQQKNWYHTYLPSPHRLTHGKRNPIAKWLDELKIFDLHAPEKHLPEILFRQPLQNIALLLSHLWSTDGSITYNGKNGFRIYYASSSQKLINQIHHLLLRFGIVARSSYSQKTGYKPTYYLDVSGSTDQLNFCQNIGIVGRKNQMVKKAICVLAKITANPNCDIIPKEIWSEVENARKNLGWSQREFHSQMDWAYSGTQRYKNGLSRTRLQKVAKTVQSPALVALAQSDIYWDKIVNIKPLGEEIVYDLTIPFNHNFVANDIIVHNSIEQDADVVMFIYRDEYYDSETEKKNIADILIKKHRNGPIGNIELFFVPEQMKFTTIERTRRDFNKDSNEDKLKGKGRIKAE